MLHEVTKWAEYLAEDTRVPKDGRAEFVRQVSSCLNERAKYAARDAGRAFNIDVERQRFRSMSGRFITEVFARLFEDAPALDSPAPDCEFFGRLHDALSRNTHFTALQKSCDNDPALSAIGTSQLVEGLVKNLAKLEAEQNKQDEQKKREAEGKRVRERKADPDAVMDVIVRKAVGKASQGTSDARAALEGLRPGLGKSAEGPNQERDNKSRFQLATKLLRHPRLIKVMKLAGRLRRTSRGMTAPGRGGADKVVGIERGGDLSRVLPAELANLSPGNPPALRALALARWASRNMRQYAFRGAIPQGAGPVVVLLDESGSMQRDGRYETASALAIACLGMAAHSKRDACIIGFNTDITFKMVLKGDRVSIFGSTPESGLTLEEATWRLLARHPRGGTRFSPALLAGLEFIKEQPKADILAITDGHCNVDPDALEAVQEARSRGMRVFGLTIGGGHFSQAVRQVCDRVDDMDEAIQNNDEARIAGAVPWRK
tara:strand:- start:243 stop:1709 length:1467 start_codon:yes stop_codon:yes gene_type:complete